MTEIYHITPLRLKKRKRLVCLLILTFKLFMTYIKNIDNLMFLIKFIYFKLRIE